MLGSRVVGGALNLITDLACNQLSIDKGNAMWVCLEPSEYVEVEGLSKLYSASHTLYQYFRYEGMGSH